MNNLLDRKGEVVFTLMRLLAGMCLLLFICFFNAQSASAFQQSPENTENNTSAETQESGETEFTDTVLRASRGDTAAWLEIAMRFLVPAIIALVVLVIGYFVSAYVGRFVGDHVSKRVDLTLGQFAAKAIRVILFIVVLIGVLGYFGVDVTSVAALLAAAGFTVGMALQGTLSNFAAGIIILVFRPYKIGDWIVAAGSSGKVVEIALFTTNLTTADNRKLIVPNSEIFGSTIENVTALPIRRVDVSVGVQYRADIQTTREVLLSAAKRTENVLESPEPVAVLTELGSSSLNWAVRVWCNSDDFWTVKEQLTEAIKYKLDAANIGIPYPTMDLNVTNQT